MRYLAVVFALTAIPFSAAQASREPAVCTSNLDSEKPDVARSVTDFWQEFQSALKKKDKNSVSALANYPLEVHLPTASLTIRTKEEFKRDYDRIFSSEFRDFLIRRSSACVRRVGSRGFSIGHGQVWFDRYPDGKVRFFSVNVVLYPGE